ncbi:MAG: hypothetical protein CMF68_07460 [Magnetovibrio sp.]|nr:hypothetical protein [Magnetovibrio sp.]
MSSFMGIFRPKCLGILLLGLFILGFDAGAAQANSAWKQLRGHSACGGVDQRGNLQEPCGFDRAKFESKAVGKCPKGSFFDIGTWACFSCPKGFNRNARPVTSPRACDKPIKGSTTKAVFLGKVSCPSGAFLDPRNGGECWKCPSGYGRTAAAVDKWNACGRVGKKAVSAEFKGKACNAEGAFRDPRNGGECWKCPEDHLRTAAAVTAGNACQTNLDFEPATKTAALTCPAGQHFDFIDGGTCWSCPQDTTRSTSGVKTAKACRIKKMRWVLPERGKYSLLSLGRGAEDILAKLIAERTRIDDAAKAAAKASGEPEAEAITNVWKVIDANPSESPVLSALLAQIVMETAVKPAAQRTASEKDLLAIVANLIQWNRQFVAYQSKQAFDAYFVAANKANAIALSKMGAASIYAGGVIAPPDYNEIVGGAIQMGAGFAGPVGAAMITFIKPVNAALLPYRALQAAKKAASAAKVAGEVAKTAAVSSSWTGASAAMAAAAPMVIAAAAAVVVTMEMDKLLKTEEMEGKIRQAIDISNRPVDIGLLLQMKEGPDEFLFHWAAVIGGKAQPSANFKTRLAAYKAGKDPDAKPTGPTMPTINMGSNVTVNSNQPAPDTFDPDKVKIETIPSTSVVVGSQGPAAAPMAEKALIAAIKRQRTQPKGTLRFELTNAPGLCLSKSEGPTEAMALADCNQRDTLWIRPNEKPSALVFDSKYCVGVGDAKLQDRAKVLISKCQTTPNMQWELQADGHVKMLKADFCMTVIDKAVKGAEVLLQKCNAKRPRQIWRPWAAAR